MIVVFSFIALVGLMYTIKSIESLNYSGSNDLLKDGRSYYSEIRDGNKIVAYVYDTGMTPNGTPGLSVAWRVRPSQKSMDNVSKKYPTCCVSHEFAKGKTRNIYEKQQKEESRKLLGIDAGSITLLAYNIGTFLFCFPLGLAIKNLNIDYYVPGMFNIVLGFCLIVWSSFSIFIPGGFMGLFGVALTWYILKV